MNQQGSVIIGLNRTDTIRLMAHLFSHNIRKINRLVLQFFQPLLL